jgi:hypothetical protein
MRLHGAHIAPGLLLRYSKLLKTATEINVLTARNEDEMKNKKKIVLILALAILMVILALPIRSDANPPKLVKGLVSFEGSNWECNCPQPNLYDCYCILPGDN